MANWYTYPIDGMKRGVIWAILALILSLIFFLIHLADYLTVKYYQRRFRYPRSILNSLLVMYLFPASMVFLTLPWSDSTGVFLFTGVVLLTVAVMVVYVCHETNVRKLLREPPVAPADPEAVETSTTQTEPLTASPRDNPGTELQNTGEEMEQEIRNKEAELDAVRSSISKTKREDRIHLYRQITQLCAEKRELEDARETYQHIAKGHNITSFNEEVVLAEQSETYVYSSE